MVLDSDKDIKDAVSKLTSDGIFRIVEIYYSEKFFGNYCIHLKSNVNFDIRFIRDRGFSWCELGLSKQKQEWFDIRDILTIMCIQVEVSGDSLVNVINRTTDIMNQYFSKIEEAFNENNFSETKSNIKVLIRKRMEEMGWMKLYDNVKVKNKDIM